MINFLYKNRYILFLLILSLILSVYLFRVKDYKGLDMSPRIEQLSSGVVFYNNDIMDIDFNLKTSKLDDFNLDSFSGKWHLMFFGYSKCPSFCPEILAKMDAVSKKLGKEVIYTMVSIDPMRDSPKVLAEYLSGINKNFLGITGDFDNVNILANHLNLVIGQYNATEDHIEHSSNLALIGPDMRLHAIISMSEPPGVIVQDIRKIKYDYFH